MKRSPCLLSGLHWETLEDVKAGIDTKRVLFSCPVWLLRFLGCADSQVSVLLLSCFLHYCFSDCHHGILAKATSELVCTHHLGSSRDESKPPCCRQSQEPPTLAYPVPAVLAAFPFFPSCHPQLPVLTFLKWLPLSCLPSWSNTPMKNPPWFWTSSPWEQRTQ